MSEILQHRHRTTINTDYRNNVSVEEKHDIHVEGRRGVMTVKAMHNPQGGNRPMWIVPGGRIIKDRREAVAAAYSMAGEEF